MSTPGERGCAHTRNSEKDTWKRISDNECNNADSCCYGIASQDLYNHG